LRARKAIKVQEKCEVSQARDKAIMDAADSESELYTKTSELEQVIVQISAAKVLQSS
jgi:hypothetical protein